MELCKGNLKIREKKKKSASINGDLLWFPLAGGIFRLQQKMKTLAYPETLTLGARDYYFPARGRARNEKLVSCSPTRWEKTHLWHPGYGTVSVRVICEKRNVTWRTRIS